MGNKFTRSKSIKSGASDDEIREFLKHVRPLDLLVFRGTEVFSKAIRTLESAVTGSGEISHVEMCITRELCPSIGPIKAKTRGPLNGDKTLLSWGSTASGPLSDGVANAETGKSYFGVQVRVLYDLVRGYLSAPGGNVGVCRLHENPCKQLPREPLDAYLVRRGELVAKLQKAYADYNGKTYDANMLSLLSALFPALRGIHNASTPVTAKFFGMNKWLFCSEFVATVYIEIGVITDATDGKEDGKTLDPAHVLPVDFIGFDTDSSGIQRSICDKPLWIKPLTGSRFERFGSIVHNVVSLSSLPEGLIATSNKHVPIKALNLAYLTPAESAASLGMDAPKTDQHGYKISPARGAALMDAAADAANSTTDSSSAQTSTISSSSVTSTVISAEPPPVVDAFAPKVQDIDKHTDMQRVATAAKMEIEPSSPSAHVSSAVSPAFVPISPQHSARAAPASARIPSTPVSARDPAALSSARSPSALHSARREREKSAARGLGAASARDLAAPASSRKPESARKAHTETPEMLAALAAAADTIAERVDDSDASEAGFSDDTNDIPIGERPGSIRLSIVDDATAQSIESAKPKKVGRIRKILGRGK